MQDVVAYTPNGETAKNRLAEELKEAIEQLTGKRVPPDRHGSNHRLALNVEITLKHFAETASRDWLRDGYPLIVRDLLAGLMHFSDRRAEVEFGDCLEQARKLYEQQTRAEEENE